MLSLDELFERTFLTELRNIDEESFILPNEPIDPGEKEIGKMTGPEKRLHTLAMQKDKICEELCPKCKTSIALEQDAIKKKCRSLNREIDACLGLLWPLIRERLDQEGKIGIKEGDKIVSIPEE